MPNVVPGHPGHKFSDVVNADNARMNQTALDAIKAKFRSRIQARRMRKAKKETFSELVSKAGVSN
jgi:hypothetical protein